MKRWDIHPNHHHPVHRGSSIHVCSCCSRHRGRQPLLNKTSFAYSGEPGFTLIEILVVLAVLGLVATIVILNLTGVLGSGAVEAANTEAHQVQSAVVAYVQANNLKTWDGVVDKAGTSDVHSYLLNPGTLQARYTIEGASIVGAFAYPDGKWSDCV